MQVSFQHSFVYLLITNMVSTCTAVYGLMLLRNAFRPELEKQFFIMGKFASVQLTLILGSLVLIILAILIGNGVIGCSPLLSPKGRADGETSKCVF
jgi:NADH:ubiquinone oxidoreductase subunit 4 (subunit M)